MPTGDARPTPTAAAEEPAPSPRPRPPDAPVVDPSRPTSTVPVRNAEETALQLRITQFRARAKACYQTALANDPNVAGSTPTLVLTTNASGEVVTSTVKCSGLPPALTECIRKAALGMKFDAGAGTHTVGPDCKK
jgi:hypothetical protein